MEDLAENFVEQFHALEGATLGEKTRNLFILFRNNPFLHNNECLLDSIMSQLQPRTHLEKVFFVEFLIHYRRFTQLFSEFIKGNETFVRRLANESWFFNKAYENVDEDFVTHVLPSLSFRLRSIVLKRMVSYLTQSQGDGIFDALLNTYGLFMATTILTCCSITKINTILNQLNVKLGSNELKALFDKDPTLIYTYLEQQEKHDGNRKFMDNNPIFSYIAEKNVDMYYELYWKYKFKVKLSRRITEKIVIAKRAEIIANPVLYVKNLHPGKLVRKLGPDFTTVYFKLFPRRVEDSPSAESSRLLKYYPKNQQYTLMSSTYNQIFHKKLEESPHLIDEYLLKMVADPNEREILAKMVGADNPNLKFFRPDHCLLAIKEKINFCKYHYERGNLVSTLTESCLINSDYGALLDVSKFVAKRFKNDTADVSHMFLQALVLQNCNFDKLGNEHWNIIRAILIKCEVEKDRYHDVKKQVFLKYVEFLCKEGRPINGEILRFFSGFIFESNDLKHIDNKPATRRFLCTFLELVPQMQSSTKVEDLDFELILACKKFNKDRPKNAIDILQYPRILQWAQNTLNKTSVNKASGSATAYRRSRLKYSQTNYYDEKKNELLCSALEFLVCTKQTSEEIRELRELYCINFTKVGTSFSARWFLTHRPNLVAKHLDSYVGFCVNKPDLKITIWRALKYYSHLELDQKVIHCLLFLLNDKDFTNIQFIPTALSFLMESHEFLKLAESYKPNSYKPDLQDNEVYRRFEVQKGILKSLEHVKPASGILNLILQFCGGDYTSWCLGSLYSVSYNIPQIQINGFLKELYTNEDVLIKKHSVHLICDILDKSAVFDLLITCNLPQIPALSYKYFLKNPCEESWELFKSMLKRLDKEDITAVKIFVQKPVPNKFKVQHFETVWQLLQRSENKYKIVLLKSLQRETICQLNSEVFRTMADEYLFEIEEMNKIIAIYIIYCQQPEKFDVIFNCLQKKKLLPQFSTKKVGNFIKTLFTIYMDSQEQNPDLILSFSTKFEQIFRAAQTFEEHVAIALMQFKNQTLQDFGTSIVILHNDLVAKYGETITNIFATSLQRLLPHFCKNNQQLYEFYDMLLHSKQTVCDVLLIIKLLPLKSAPEDLQSYKYYDHILSELQNINFASVRLQLNLHFKLQKNTRHTYYERINGFCVNTASWLFPGAYIT